MSEEGKRARLDEHKHKRGYAQIDKESEMNRQELFACEVILDAADLKTNDEI